MDVLETGKKRNDDKRPSRGEEKRGEKSARSIEQNAGASILKRHFDQRRSVKSVKWWMRINSITKNGSHLEEKDFLDHRRRIASCFEACYGDFDYSIRAAIFPRGNQRSYCVESAYKVYCKVT